MARFGRQMLEIYGPPLRVSEGNDPLKMAIREAIAQKPKGHDFIIDRTGRQPAVARQMGGDRGLTRTLMRVIRDSMFASSPEQIPPRVSDEPTNTNARSGRD
jgi:hypothetical protein